MQVYACLLGNWVDLSADRSVRMGEHRVSADIWYEENAKIWSPKTNKVKTIELTLYLFK